jgi:hypothetical protein
MKLVFFGSEAASELTRQTCVSCSTLIPTCSRFPSVRRERRVVLNLVSQDRGAVVAHRLPDHRRVLGLTFDPSQARWIWNILKTNRNFCFKASKQWPLAPNLRKSRITRANVSNASLIFQKRPLANVGESGESVTAFWRIWQIFKLGRFMYKTKIFLGIK